MWLCGVGTAEWDRRRGERWIRSWGYGLVGALSDLKSVAALDQGGVSS